LLHYLTACPDGAAPADLGPSPSASFYAPQAIAAGSRHVVVASTGFHYEGGKPAWDPGLVTLIRRADRLVVATIRTTQLNPQAAAVHGERGYVVNGGTYRVDQDGLVTAASDGGVDIIDLGDPGGSAPRLAGNIPLGRSAADARIGGYGSIAIDPAGKMALIGSGTRGDLFSVDLEQRRVVRGADNPIALFPTAAGDNGMTTVRPLPGSKAGVLSFNSDELCIGEDWTAMASPRCGVVGVQQKLVEGPIDAAAAPDGRLLVLMSIANSLYRVDLAGQPFSVEHDFAKTGLSNNRVVVHGGMAYVVNTLSNNLQRVDLATGKTDLPFAVLPVGSMPYDMVVTEETDGALAWVTLNGAHAVALVRISDGKLLTILRGAAVADAGPVEAAAPDAAPTVDLTPDLRPCPEAGLPEVVGIGNVVQVSYGAGAGDGQAKLPNVIQGGPSGAAGGSTDDVLSLGAGGQIVVDFGPSEIVDGPGPDFIVFENPFLMSPFNPFAEPARVAVSATDSAAASFVEFPCDLSVTQGDPAKQTWPYPGCAGVRPVLASPAACLPATDPSLAGGDAFDLADLGLKQARYLRITDAGVSKMGQTSKGFDLDAVVLIHHQAR